MTTHSLSESRRCFESAPECRFVSAEVFIERLTCHESLVRADEPSVNLYGLLDPRSGDRIYVRMEELAVRRRTGPADWGGPAGP